MSTRQLVAFGFLACSALVMSQIAPDADWGIVRSARFVSVDRFGHHLNYRLEKFVSFLGERDLISRCENLVCHDLPVGTYKYVLHNLETGDVVEDRALLTLRDQVIVVDAKARGRSAARENSGVTVVGRIDRLPADGSSGWVKLDGLFARFAIEAPLDPKNQFTLRGVPPGSYILLIFRNERLLLTQLLTLAPRPPANPFHIVLKFDQPPTIMAPS